MNSTNRGKNKIIGTAQRIVALVLVLCMMIPSRAYAIGTAISAGKQLLGGDEKKEEEIEHSAIADEYASEAEKLKKRLESGDQNEKKKLRLSQCKTLAVALNEKIEAVDMQIDSKTVKMQSSVRSLRERERSMGTVRWSPIFNIKLPEEPKEVEAFEFQFKPTQMQNQITMLKHKIVGIELDTNEKVSNTYIRIIAAKDEVDRLTTRRRKLQATVNKLEVKLKDGTAVYEANATTGLEQEDEEGNKTIISPRVLKAKVKQAQDRYDTAVQRLENCENELANANTAYEEAKIKMGKMINFTITDRFNFEDAFITANLNRDNIEYLYDYALDDDSSVYEAKMAADEALLTLRINYDLMKKHYSNYIGLIEPYVQQALEGSKIPKKAFKKDYDQFLKDIDAEWQGSYKIWFISIPKEWLKGDTDGIRYVEDDPYVLYSAALDYESARKEYENAKMDLYNNVYEAYSNYASTRKAYLNANKAYIKAEKTLGLSEVSYLLGELTQEEFEQEETEFNDLKDEAADALKEFSENLYSFDRTTCGGLSKFFEGAETDANTEALSLVPVIRTGCIYTIRPIIDSEEFLLSIDVPDDFYANTGINITHFQLVCDGVVVGNKSKDENGKTVYEKTPVGENIRHLMLSTANLGECAIRVYDGNTFIDECRIEPTVFSGPLNIKVGYEDEVNAHTLGTYTTSDEVSTDMLVLTINLDQTQVTQEYLSGQEAAYYRLCVAQDSYVLSDRLVPVDQQFTYMSFLKSDLNNVFIELFDKDGEKIGDAKFDTISNEIYNDVDEKTAEEIAAQKRKEAEEKAIREAEEARLAEIQAQRDAAAELLRSLGMATDDESIDYALKHLNELNYEVELLTAIGSLEKEHERDLKKYEEMKADPKTKAADLRAMEDRIRITGEMPKIYRDTLGEGIDSYIKALEDSRNAKLAQLLVEYVVSYSQKAEAGEGADVSELDAKMTEIENQVVSDFQSNVITEFKEIMSPFEEAIKRLKAYKPDDLGTTDKFSDIKNDIEICNGCITKITNSEFATAYSFKRYSHEAAATPLRDVFGSILGNAIFYVIKQLGAKIDDLNANFNLTVYTIKKSDYQYADAVDDFLYVLRDNCKSAYGSEYKGELQAETEKILKSIQNYAEAVEDIWRERMLLIMSYNDILSNNYDLLIPYGDFGDEYKELETEMKAKQSELENIARELSVKEADMKEKKAKFESNANSHKIVKFFKKLVGVDQNLDREYMHASTAYVQCKARYEVCNGRIASIQEKYKIITEMIYDYLGTMNASRDKCKEVIAEIEKLEGEPKYTVEQVDEKYNEALGAVRDRFEEFLVAQYASNYNRANDPSAADELKGKSENMMSDIEKQLKDLGTTDGEDKLAEFKEKVKPFDSAVSELYNITLDQILSPDDVGKELAAKYDPVLTMGSEMMEQGFGYGYITRIDSAMAVGCDAVVARVDEIDPSSIEAFVDYINSNSKEMEKLRHATAYYKDKLTFNGGEATRANRLLEEFYRNVSQSDDMKETYIDELNDQLDRDYDAIRPRFDIDIVVRNYSVDVRDDKDVYDPLKEKEDELQAHYDKTIQAYCEYYKICVEKVYPAKKALEEAKKSGDEEEIKKCQAAYDEIKEFEKELSDSHSKADYILKQILEIREEMGDKARNHEKYLAQLEFYKAIQADYENKERELYDDALKCIELIRKLGGRPYHDEARIKEVFKETGLQ